MFPRESFAFSSGTTKNPETVITSAQLPALAILAPWLSRKSAKKSRKKKVSSLSRFTKDCQKVMFFEGKEDFFEEKSFTHNLIAT
jgi:hypothetical protein